METAFVGFVGSEMLNYFNRYLSGCCAQLKPWQRERILFKEQSWFQILFFLLTNQCQTTEQAECEIETIPCLTHFLTMNEEKKAEYILGEKDRENFGAFLWICNAGMFLWCILES